MNLFLSKKNISVLSLAALPLVASCYFGAQRSNFDFEKKFSSQVNKIKEQRQMIDEKEVEEMLEQVDKAVPIERKEYDDPARILAVMGPITSGSAYFDTSKLKLKQPEEYTPNQQIINQGLRNFAPQTLPQDIFDMTYNTRPHPPFAYTGIEFDAIEIPPYDRMGVKSGLDDKQYLLVGTNALQRNIDKVNAARTLEDIGFSQILIKEQKAINKQRKINAIFGKDEISRQKPEKKEVVEDWEKNKRMKREDPMRKIIAAQIVAQNINSNMSDEQKKQAEQQRLQQQASQSQGQQN